MGAISILMPAMFAADAAPLALAIQRPLTAAAKTAVRGVLKQIENGTTKGKPFENAQGKLPSKPEGYYREYTAPLPGESGRGASRVVTGAGGEVYYTPDHYYSFTQVK
jgi:ribonuclease T1